MTVSAVAVVLPLAVLYFVFSYRREKLKQGPSLGVRELQQLVQQAVAEAQRPLLDRIERLERRLSAAPAQADATFGWEAEQPEQKQQPN